MNINGHECTVELEDWEHDGESPMRWRDARLVVDGTSYGVGIVNRYIHDAIDESGIKREEDEITIETLDRNWPDVDDFMKRVAGTTDPDSASWILTELDVYEAIQKTISRRYAV